MTLTVCGCCTVQTRTSFQLTSDISIGLDVAVAVIIIVAIAVVCSGTAAAKKSGVKSRVTTAAAKTTIKG